MPKSGVLTGGCAGWWRSVTIDRVVEAKRTTPHPPLIIKASHSQSPFTTKGPSPMSKTLRPLPRASPHTIPHFHCTHPTNMPHSYHTARWGAQRFGGTSTAMKIRIGPYSFEIGEPYHAGHPLTPDEARALNALRAENIRNNFSRQIKREESRQRVEVLDAEALAALRALLVEYEAGYRFSAPKTATRQYTGKLEREVESVARERVEIEARRAGRELSREEFETAVLDSMLLPAVQEEARRRVEARMQIAHSSLQELL